MKEFISPHAETMEHKERSSIRTTVDEKDESKGKLCSEHVLSIEISKAVLSLSTDNLKLFIINN